MANVLIDENALFSIAEAIRAKNGTENTYLPSEMAGAVSQIGGLPGGIAMGDIAFTEQTKDGDFSIAHGLGVMPDFVLIYRASGEWENNTIRSHFECLHNEVYDEETETYYPDVHSTRTVCDRSTGAFYAISFSPSEYLTDRNNIWLPAGNSTYSFSTKSPYKWIAIAL